MDERLLKTLILTEVKKMLEEETQTIKMPPNAATKQGLAPFVEGDPTIIKGSTSGTVISPSELLKQWQKVQQELNKLGQMLSGK